MIVSKVLIVINSSQVVYICSAYKYNVIAAFVQLQVSNKCFIKCSCKKVFFFNVTISWAHYNDSFPDGTIFSAWYIIAALFKVYDECGTECFL